MSALLIIGAGGHGRVVAEAAHLSGAWRTIAFLDDAYPELVHTEYGPVLGKTDFIDEVASHFVGGIAAVGSNTLRLTMTNMIAASGLRLAVIIHPSAVISQHSCIGLGTAVLAHTYVGIGAKIGIACIINNGSSVDHDCSIGDGVHIAPGVHLGGGVTVGAMTLLGIGAVSKQYLSIGQQVTIAAGAVVTADVPDGGVFAGIPARAMGDSSSGNK